MYEWYVPANIIQRAAWTLFQFAKMYYTKTLLNRDNFRLSFLQKWCMNTSVFCRIHTRKCSAGVVYTNAHGSLEVLAHSGFKWLKSTNNKLTWYDFTDFSNQVLDEFRVLDNSLDFRFRSLSVLLASFCYKARLTVVPNCSNPPKRISPKVISRTF